MVLKSEALGKGWWTTRPRSLRGDFRAGIRTCNPWSGSTMPWPLFHDDTTTTATTVTEQLADRPAPTRGLVVAAIYYNASENILKTSKRSTTFIRYKQVVFLENLTCMMYSCFRMSAAAFVSWLVCGVPYFCRAANRVARGDCRGRTSIDHDCNTTHVNSPHTLNDILPAKIYENISHGAEWATGLPGSGALWSIR